MANQVYNIFKYLFAEQTIDLINDTIKVILVYGYTPNIDSHDYLSAVSAYEVVGTGYTAGGATLTNKSLTRDDLNDRTVFTANDTEWTTSTLTADGAIVYKSTGVQGTSPLIAYVDFGGNKVTDGTTLKIEWNDNRGIIYVT